MNYKHLYYFWSIARAGGVLRAAEKLHITPQTLSGQIRLLEERVGKPLFRKAGRKLELTDAGRLTLGYADEIFALGAELEGALRGDAPQGLPVEFRVGIADSVPKTIAYRLLEPATQLDEKVRLVCRESKLDTLMGELALHRIDLVLSDKPFPAALNIKAFHHRLGQSGVSFFAAPTLRKRCKGAFPACLQGMPMLCMGDEAAVWGAFQGWLQKHDVRPRIVGEFDDGALMKSFGREGQGIFMGPTVLEDDICQQYRVQVLGRTTELTETFHAITVERRIHHPCVAAITTAARIQLFGGAESADPGGRAGR